MSRLCAFVGFLSFIAVSVQPPRLLLLLLLSFRLSKVSRLSRVNVGTWERVFLSLLRPPFFVLLFYLKIFKMPQQNFRKIFFAPLDFRVDLSFSTTAVSTRSTKDNKKFVGSFRFTESRNLKIFTNY